MVLIYCIVVGTHVLMSEALIGRTGPNIYGYNICKSREPSIDRYYSLSWKKNSSFKNSVRTLIVPHRPHYVR